MTDNELTIKARRIASMTIRAHKKRDGLLLVNGIGKARYATLKERVLYRMFGFLPHKL